MLMILSGDLDQLGEYANHHPERVAMAENIRREHDRLHNGKIVIMLDGTYNREIYVHYGRSSS